MIRSLSYVERSCVDGRLEACSAKDENARIEFAVRASVKVIMAKKCVMFRPMSLEGMGGLRVQTGCDGMSRLRRDGVVGDGRWGVGAGRGEK